MFFYFITHFYYVMSALSTCVCAQRMSEEHARFPGTGVTVDSEALCRCWELIPGPLQEEQVFLASEPALYCPSVSWCWPVPTVVTKCEWFLLVGRGQSISIYEVSQRGKTNLAHIRLCEGVQAQPTAHTAHAVCVWAVRSCCFLLGLEKKPKLWQSLLLFHGAQFESQHSCEPSVRWLTLLATPALRVRKLLVLKDISTYTQIKFKDYEWIIVFMENWDFTGQATLYKWSQILFWFGFALWTQLGLRLPVQPRLTLNSYPPASTSEILRLEACATVPSHVCSRLTCTVTIQGIFFFSFK